MATLLPGELPMIDPPLSGRGPVLDGEVDRGPNWIDRETVELVGQRVRGGAVTLPPSAEKALAAASPVAVNDMFSRMLAASPLTTRFTIEHRSYALIATLTELAMRFDHDTGPSGPMRPTDMEQVQWQTTQLETHLATVRPVVAQVLGMDVSEPAVQAVCSRAAMLDARSLSLMLGISQQSFTNWRQKRRGGPPWVEVSLPDAKRQKVMYPVAGVLAWLYGGVAQ